MRLLLRGEGLPELERIEALREAACGLMRVDSIATVKAGDRSLPILACRLGADDVTRPALALFAGVHGIERIGTHVVLSWLESLVERLRWDKESRRVLRKSRVIAVPVVNPGGMWMRRRSNPNGVDLMRNSPVDADVRTPFLVGGHRYTRLLPWYRGDPGEMEPETRAIAALVDRELFPAQASIVLDVHSGFGRVDRIWYPYAKTTRPLPSLAQVSALTDLFDRTYPYHPYRVEAQHESYTTHGDLWDYLYDLQRARHPERIFLPFTLEIGSWQWVRKDLRQLFAAGGVFNPLEPHRYHRALRRHGVLLDFLLRAARNHRRWSGIAPPQAAAPESREKSSMNPLSALELETTAKGGSG
jgi:predicted deacylase